MRYGCVNPSAATCPTGPVGPDLGREAPCWIWPTRRPVVKIYPESIDRFDTPDLKDSMEGVLLTPVWTCYQKASSFWPNFSKKPFFKEAFTFANLNFGTCPLKVYMQKCWAVLQLKLWVFGTCEVQGWEVSNRAPKSVPYIYMTDRDNNQNHIPGELAAFE